MGKKKSAKKSASRSRTEPPTFTAKVSREATHWSDLKGVASKRAMLKVFSQHWGAGGCSDDNPVNFLSCARCGVLKHGTVTLRVRLTANET